MLDNRLSWREWCRGPFASAFHAINGQQMRCFLDSVLRGGKDAEERGTASSHVEEPCQRLFQPIMHLLCAARAISDVDSFRTSLAGDTWTRMSNCSISGNGAVVLRLDERWDSCREVEGLICGGGHPDIVDGMRASFNMEVDKDFS